MDRETILKAIPRSMYADGTSETVELADGLAARIQLMLDDCNDAPWDREDGHGPVSDWRPTSSKRPGERVLCSDRGHARFYDYEEAIKIAKRDGWGLAPEEAARYPTPAAVRAAAVEKDFEYLEGWCTDKWNYIGVSVTLLDADGRRLAQSSLWGIESCGDYWREVAADLVDECMHEAAEQMRTAAIKQCFC